MSKSIKNDTWTVKELITKIDNKEIDKPKFQRKKKWSLKPDKNTRHTPNEKSFIEFLYKNNNSVHSITFGKNKDNTFTNIDGNNRINALCHFINTPFDIFPEYLDNINNFIYQKILDVSIQTNIINIIKNLKYTEIMNMDEFFNYNHIELFDKHIKPLWWDLKKYIDIIKRQLKNKNSEDFDNYVRININIFEGYNTDELCEVFEDINKYNSMLTDIELLASKLYNINNFKINGEPMKSNIKNALETYYLKKSDNEALECYKFNINENINAHDFIVGFQNYSHTQCNLIEEINNDGLALYFKIYKILYGGYENEHFTTNNINDFIDKINKVLLILNEIEKSIFTDIFKSSAFIDGKKTTFDLKRNKMYLIICAIIGYINKNILSMDIQKSITKCLLYHSIVRELKTKDEKINFSVNDTITYKSGGNFIDGKAREIYDDPDIISKKITKEIMEKLFMKLLEENNNPINYDEDNERHKLKLYEKTLIYYYYKTRVPTSICKNKFSTEHIIPFSSRYNDVLDINRLGNIISIVDTLNCQRGNKHIKVYKKYDSNNTLKLLNDIFSLHDKYDEIVNHDNKHPIISNNDKYNNFCNKNEETYIENFLEYFYPS